MENCASDEALLKKYLPEAMERYFTAKLPELDRGELLVRIAECLKGLALTSAGNILFSNQIDTIWHYWILQTRQYAELCAQLPGGTFQHHSSADYPDDESSPLQADYEVDRIIAFFASYVQNFGPLEASRLQYWPALENLTNALGWDLARTNAFLLEKAQELEIALGQIGTPSPQTGSAPAMAAWRGSESDRGRNPGAFSALLRRSVASAGPKLENDVRPRAKDGLAPSRGADIPYLRNFIKELAPGWLDHAALVSGIAPPAREGGFGWCDLGCGQGVTTTVLAATHPSGRFCGIDALPAHIDHARNFAAECAAENAEFHLTDFDKAAEIEFEGFDYIVSHGVYSWISAGEQDALRHFIDRHLKPGGLAYLSYYAMPGRAADLPFQRLVREIGRTIPGDTASVCNAAIDIVNRLTALKAPALAASPFAIRTKEHPEDYSPGYLAHDFMVANWEPLCVSEVRAGMAAIGLEPVGSANFIQNYDLVQAMAARETLALIGDENARELARDFLLNQCFRLDVFVREARRIDEEDRRGRLLDSTFMLTRPAVEIEYAVATPAGRLTYDTPLSRAIAASLATGPMSLTEIAARSGFDPQEVLDCGLALCAYDILRPVERGRVDVERVNLAIRRRLGGAVEIPYLALPCGTMLKMNVALRGLMRCVADSTQGDMADWRGFLAACGISCKPSE